VFTPVLNQSINASWRRKVSKLTQCSTGRSHSFVTLASCCVLLFSSTASTAEIQVLINDLPGADADIGNQILASCTERGLSAKAISPSELDEDRLSTPSHDSLLILTDCGTLPLDAAKPLDHYLATGGRMIALGGTLFRHPIAKVEGKWLTREGCESRWAEIPLGHLVADFSSVDLEKWSRSCNESGHASRAEITQDPERGSCLHSIIKSLNGWDTFCAPPLDTPIPEGHKYTCFWAKGGPNTDRLLFEWEEQDGSRWMATVTLTQQWKRYVLSESDFHFWESLPARASTHLQLSHAKKFNTGLALTHSPGLSGDHEFWISEVGTCQANALPDLDWNVAFKHRDLLYPIYHAYPCSDVGQIELSSKQALVDDLTGFTLPAQVEAFHPRPQSTTIRRERNHRWVPLLDARSPGGDFRGTVAALRFTSDLAQMWAACAITDPRFYHQRPVQVFVAALAERMLTPCFLWEGGASKYTHFPDHFVSVGAQAIADESARTGLAVRMEVIEEPSKKVVWSDEGEPAYEPDYELLLDDVEFAKGTDYWVTVSLLRDGIVIDRLVHPLHIWEPDQHLGLVTIRKGDFILNGKPWFPYGVNYMPASGIAREEGEPFEYWLGPRGYDPEIVDRDLSRIEGMGLNMVSVFLYYGSLPAWNLPDLIRLCEKHHLRVNLSLRPGTPLDFEWDQVKEMIETNRLATNRTLFAYDLAWEPHFGGFEERSRYTKQWNEWITKKHGDLDSAFKAWNHHRELDQAGLLPVPQSKEWYESGPWDAVALDYGLFLNDLLAEHYGHARDLVRSIDPNHAVSFRMQESGDPTYRGPDWIPYDFKGVAKAVDIMEPEGYGRLGGWEQVRPGRFTVDYARAVAPDLPVMWAEMGQSAWDMASMGTPDRSLERVATFYRDFHRMLLDSHSNGVVFWWYPGGFRVGERSDYGILNPDGTDRPVTHVIREMGPLVRNQGPRPEPDTWITLDPTARPGGLAGMYKQVKEDYWRAIEEGKKVGLKLGN
jgi:hypothetical protein